MAVVSFVCCKKPGSLAFIKKASKELVLPSQTKSLPSISRDSTTASANGVRKNAMPLPESTQALDSSTQPLDNGGDSSCNPSSEFVNHGLLRWNQMREQWVGNKKKASKRLHIRDPVISSYETYESLLRDNTPFAEPIPLAEMVYVIVDEWEQEGLYDLNNAMLQ